MGNETIGICPRPGSFSDRWLSVCKERGIPWEEVDVLSPDVILAARRFKSLLWHWDHMDVTAAQMARQVTMALEAAGLAVFPNSRTCWHYDDKVAQKYLLEAIGAPVPRSWVFYELERALEWVEAASFPKVFKLRSGAGSSNVRLARNRSEARTLCRRAFTVGFPAAGSYFDDARTKVRRIKSPGALLPKLRRAPTQILRSVRTNFILPRSRGYVFFQELVPGNTYDTRVTVIGRRAFGFIRHNRPGDFRASGSGNLDVDPARVDQECVKMAFDVAEKLGTQSLAFDFVREQKVGPVIVEISYCYMAEPVHRCPGHWDHRLNWHPGNIWPQDAILDDILRDS